MESVSSVSYSIQINGNYSSLIKPSKGLRRWDPLFPFLYLFCAEDLSLSLNTSALEGIPISQYNLTVKHLLFTDNSIIFTRATIKDVRILKCILYDYSMASGRVVYLMKSSIFFSPKPQGLP